MSDLRNVEPIVKPRKPYKERRQILAINRDGILLERTGEVLDRAELPYVIAEEPSSIIATTNAAGLLMELEAFFHESASWSWRVTPVERRVYRQHRKATPTVTRDAVVNYFGFRFEDPTTGRTRTHYHYPIDTLTFLSGNSAVGLGDVHTLRFLLQWGVDVRDFCSENELKIKPTSGGLAAQLLRDARFFPNPRRKIPRATNSRARDVLPGNHYELFVPEDSSVSDALYLDMRGAHHFAASQLVFPHPDRLYGRGKFRNPPESVTGEPWAKHGTAKFRSVLAGHGLFLLRINVPKYLQATTDHFPPPWLRKPSGSQLAYVYSNELPLLSRFPGVVLEGVEAAWTASLTDAGLNRYAQWATRETAAMSPERKAWAKSTLLATYGLLAARPRAREFGYRHAKRSEQRVYMTHGGPLAVEALTTSKEIESPVVNVILRGMIEAQVRIEVLSLATDLHTYGVRILALYADSVIVSADTQLPILPPPWIVKTSLTRLTFFNPVSFLSDEMERMPGVTPEGRRRIANRRMMAAATGAGLARDIWGNPAGGVRGFLDIVRQLR